MANKIALLIKKELIKRGPKNLPNVKELEEIILNITS